MAGEILGEFGRGRQGHRPNNHLSLFRLFWLEQVASDVSIDQQSYLH